jgi:hypothetical protein
MPLLACFITLTITSAVTGCAVGVGTRSGEVTTTKGQELFDLERARKAGLITPAEFSTQRQKILDR